MIPITKLRKCNRKYKTKERTYENAMIPINKARKM